MEREREERKREREVFWWYVSRQSWRWNNEPTNRRGPCKSPGLAPPLSPLCATLPSTRDGGRVLRGFRRSCRHSNCSHRQSLQLVLHTHGSGTRVSPVTAKSSFWLCFLWSIGDRPFLLSFFLYSNSECARIFVPFSWNCFGQFLVIFEIFKER